jgi:hypothetical protein
MDLVGLGYAGDFKFDGKDRRLMATGIIATLPASFYIEISGDNKRLRGIGFVDSFNTRCVLHGQQQDMENCSNGATQ